MNRKESIDFEPSENVELSSSPMMRWALIATGTVMTALGFIGILLPLIPTTPFLLLAAYCYARSSRKLYDWLLRTHGIGPLIRQYREHKVIPTYAKVLAVSMITVTIGLSVWFSVPIVPVKILLIIIGASVSAWILSHPSKVPS